MGNWLEQFLDANENGDIDTLHTLRLEIYKETIGIVMQGKYTVNGREIKLPDTEQLQKGSRLYSAVAIDHPEDLPNYSTEIEVIASDSLLAGKKLLDEGYNPAVLNFANRQTPGGGVKHGAGAQEENIFRRSSLFMSLYQYHYDGISLGIPQSKDHYPMDRNTGGCYTGNVCVFRGLETDGYPLLEHPYSLGIVTVAAMNRPELKNAYQIADHLVEPIKQKIRTIYRIALKHGHDALVLGAWGCGAFKNPPQHIAKLFHQVLEEKEFANHFRKIVFAIYDRQHIDIRDGKTGNMLPFREEFANYGKTAKQVHLLLDDKELKFSKFKGMFWGLVVGDCLGSAIQFTSKDNHPYITEMEECHTSCYETPAGYWTDDSSMAFCVAESVMRLKTYSLLDIANNFVRWISDGFMSSLPQAFDVGSATIDGIEGLKRGRMQNGSENSQGNGSIMRFAPTYILNYGKADNSILHAISDLTHCSQRVRETVDKMAAICDEHLIGRRTHFKSLYSNREEVNNSGWAVSTLEAALWAFETSDNFEDGMVAAVNLGGDSDSIGAVYGQIAGAYYGFDAIPKRWIDAVKSSSKVNDLIESFISTCEDINSESTLNR